MRLAIERVAWLWNLNLRKIEANAVALYRRELAFKQASKLLATPGLAGALAKAEAHLEAVRASVDGERMVLTRRMERQTAAMVAMIGAETRRTVSRERWEARKGTSK